MLRHNFSTVKRTVEAIATAARARKARSSDFAVGLAGGGALQPDVGAAAPDKDTDLHDMLAKGPLDRRQYEEEDERRCRDCQAFLDGPEALFGDVAIPINHARARRCPVACDGEDWQGVGAEAREGGE